MPRPRKRTPAQAIFIEKYAKTGDPTYAAFRAGYAQPEISGHVILRQASIRDALEARRLARNEISAALPAIIAEHKRRLLDPATTNREFSALVAPFYKAARLSDEATEQKEPHEMTADEIAAAIDALERKAMENAKLIEDAAPQQSSAFG